MKNLFILLFVCSSSLTFAQPNFGVQKKDSCFKKAQERAKNRFAEWECGKLAGVVDCNEKLEMDPTSGVVMTSGNHQPFTGTCETCHMNGMHERTVHFVNGRSEGVDTTTYKDGCLMVIRSHIQGAEHGKWTYFYDSTGYENWIKNYNMGELHGPQYDFSRNGDTVRVENYINGVLNGAKLTYRYNPATKHNYMEKKTNYKNGLLDGQFLIYNPDKVVIEETYFKEGKKNGVFKYYYDDGVLLRTENWTNGVKNGEFKTLYYNGDLQAIEQYKKGLKEGWFEERFPDQKLKRRAFYAKDKLVEETVYDQLGKIVSQIGKTESTGNEDDAMPTTKKDKTKKDTPAAPATEKKKKEKKPKKEKEESSTPATEGKTEGE